MASCPILRTGAALSNHLRRLSVDRISLRLHDSLQQTSRVRVSDSGCEISELE